MSTPLRRTPATLDILRCLYLATGPQWGLKMVRESGRPTGTVYPLLERLEQASLVESQWDTDPRPGPRRRLYQLTKEGERFASSALAPKTAKAPKPTTRTVTI